MTWTGLAIFAHAALGYRNFKGMIFGYVVVALIVAAAIWVVSLSLHIVVSLGWIHAPGYRFDARDYFLIGGGIFLLMLTAVSLGRKGWILFAVAAAAFLLWGLRLSGRWGEPAHEPATVNLPIFDEPAN